jgi:ABC-type transport system involved in cytochrome c biogenesis permease subunit
MSIYVIILVVHIISAVCSLGAVFANPSIMKKGTTVPKAKQALETAKDVEKYAKVGSITLLITGLILGILNPSLFTQAWYIVALLLYLAVQPIVAYMIPKKVKQLNGLLEKQDSENLPSEFLPIAMKIGKLDNIARSAIVVLIILMTIKPF